MTDTTEITNPFSELLKRQGRLQFTRTFAVSALREYMTRW